MLLKNAAPYAIFLIASLVASLGGCTLPNATQADDVEQIDETALTQQTESVRIRVHNQSSSKMNDIVIDFVSPEDEAHINLTSQKEEYGSLDPAEMSDYRIVGSTYGYAPMEMLINEEKIRRGVIDFVGESTIPNGNYTYALTYGPDQYSKGADRLMSYLVYEQTALDKEISRALDEEITEAIADEYYPEEFTIHWFSCVHQQTHRGVNKGTSQMVVYAKIVCTVPFSEPWPDKEMESIPPLPVRLEIQESEDLYDVVGYQFPKATSQYEADMRDIFASEAIAQIDSTTISPETYNRLQLKRGPVR